MMSGAETVTQVVLALEVPIVSVTVSRSFIELDEPNGRVVWRVWGWVEVRVRFRVRVGLVWLRWRF